MKIFSDNALKVQRNKEEINKRNKVMMGISLVTLLGIYFCSIFISLFVDNYKMLFWPYILMVISIIFLIVIYYFIRKKNILPFFYLVMSFFYCFLGYTSLFAQKDMVCITMLFFLFLNPVLVLDYEIRSIIVTVFYGILYMILVCVFKNKDLIFDEIFNVMTTLILGLVLDYHFSKISIENMDLKRINDIKAHTDYLTNLPNRAKLFDDFASYEHTKDISYILMVDIDYFKIYNDTYGHPMGDECLRIVTNEFKKIEEQFEGIRFYRYGGEEFIAIIQNRQQSIEEITTYIQEAIKKLQIEHKASKLGFITLSLGVSKITNDFNYEVALYEADKALYKAKDAGRNTIKYYEECVE